MKVLSPCEPWEDIEAWHAGCAGEGDQERPSRHVLQLWLLRSGHCHRQGGPDTKILLQKHTM